MMPVTCKQLFEATQAQPDDAFRIDSRELNQVTLVGLVTQMSEQSTHYSFTIDDGSALMDVRVWLEADDQNLFLRELRRTWQPHTYVRVVGHLRSFQQKRNVVAFRVQPLADPNELTLHLLDVVAAHLQNTKGPRSTLAAAPAAPVSAPFAGVGSMQDTGVAPLHKAILDTIRSRRNLTEGCSVQMLAAHLQRPEHEIRQAVDFLSSEGHLYSTIDEDHVQTTDSM